MLVRFVHVRVLGWQREELQKLAVAVQQVVEAGCMQGVAEEGVAVVEVDYMPEVVAVVSTEVLLPNHQSKLGGPSLQLQLEELAEAPEEGVVVPSHLWRSVVPEDGREPMCPNGFSMLPQEGQVV